MIHLHWEFLAFKNKKEGPETGQETMFGVTSVSVINYSNEKDAEEGARKIIERPFFFLQKVYECNMCLLQEKLVRAQEKIIKLHKPK